MAPLSAFRRSARDERGSALVEAAISMLALLALIFGVIEVGWAVYTFHYIANASHEGARYAIVRGSSWSGSCSGYGSNQCIASTTDIANYVSSRSVAGINIVATDVCVEYFATVPASASTTCSANSTPNAQGDVVQVTVTYPFTLTLPGFSRTFNLKSTSQMVIAQ